MKRFAALFAALDESTRTTVKVEALVDYFRSAPADDSAWCAAFLIGRKPGQAVRSGLLRQWAAETAGVPLWLFEESYHAVGDLAETIALLVPDSSPDDLVEKPLARWVEDDLLPLAKRPEDDKKACLLQAWRQMTRPERFMWNKLITGGFRVGVSQNLVTRAIAKVAGIDESVVAHRLMGNWSPSAEFYQSLVAKDASDSEPSRLYPFYLAYPLESDLSELGPHHDWHAEWKWDGIRSQLIRRQGQLHIWSRGEELVTDRYPELHPPAMLLPDGTVIDGELLPWDFQANRPQPFAALQKRIGRKSVGKKLLADIPVILMAYDLLEHGGLDIRHQSFSHRRAMLESIIGQHGFDGRIRLSPAVAFDSWNSLAETRLASRQGMVEGLMIKKRDSPYRVGRKRGDWWKWKIEPMTMDCVMTMAQRGSGRRASLYTDYTFAVWDRPGGSLVPVAKAYSGLTDEEIAVVDGFVRKNTTDKFGPVRAVKPEMVMEIAFEAIQQSSRHKSGLAVRFPRIARIRHDKKPEEADTLENLHTLLARYGSAADAAAEEGDE